MTLLQCCSKVLCSSFVVVLFGALLLLCSSAPCSAPTLFYFLPHSHCVPLLHDLFPSKSIAQCSPMLLYRSLLRSLALFCALLPRCSPVLLVSVSLHLYSAVLCPSPMLICSSVCCLLSLLQFFALFQRSSTVLSAAYRAVSLFCVLLPYFAGDLAAATYT